MAAGNFESSKKLKKAFAKMQKADGLTLRSWAKELMLSPALVSQVVNGKKLASLETLKKMGSSLDMDAIGIDSLLESRTQDLLKRQGLEQKQSKEQDEVEEVIADDEFLLKSWLNLALLEFTTCKGFKNDLEFLSQKFKAPKPVIQSALADLERAGFLKRNPDGSFEKISKKMRIPTHRSRKLVRDFHMQMLDRAQKTLQQKEVSPTDFSERLITGYTVAVNPENLEEAKTVLQKALIEVAHILSRGECTEVYQLQTQLFSLSK